jgi:hypothetical protein
MTEQAPRGTESTIHAVDQVKALLPNHAVLRTEKEQYRLGQYPVTNS